MLDRPIAHTVYAITDANLQRDYPKLIQHAKWHEMGPGLTLQYSTPLAYRRFFLTGMPRQKGKLLIKRYDAPSGTTILAISDASPDGCLLVVQESLKRGAPPVVVLTTPGTTINGEATNRAHLVALWAKSEAEARDVWEIIQAHNPFIDESEDWTIQTVEATAASP